eukprot:766754-Hanusia_phi.AAC.4
MCRKERDDEVQRGRLELFGESTDSAAGREQEPEIEDEIEELPGPSSDSEVKREVAEGSYDEDEDFEEEGDGEQSRHIACIDELSGSSSDGDNKRVQETVRL